jgi:hypothetical protein
LCAAWERYSESVLAEGVSFVAASLQGVNALPQNVRQKVVDHANNNATVWNPAQLATPAWTQVYEDAVKVCVDRLNTPKHRKLQPLFADYLAIADIGAAWTAGNVPIDNFVTLRGEVAHRGGQSRYIRFGHLVTLEGEVKRYVKETDNYLSDHILTLVNLQRRPWNRLA